MENEENFRDRVFKARPVLTDVTNRLDKRPFSSISGDDGDSQFTKQVCLGVENLVKKKCQLQFGANSHNNNYEGKALLQSKETHPYLKLPFCADTPPLKVSSKKSNLRSDVSEEQDLLGCGENSVGFGKTGPGRPSTEGLVNRALETDDGDLCVFDNLAPFKCGSVERTTISASHGSKFPGLERCSGLKGDGGANSVVACGDLLKTCTCSFCSKAAYIWSDLHYQDVKGRLSALKKSQKEASTMAQKFSGLNDTVIHDQQSCTESSKLELSLVHQWKSLFVHMENTFAQENSQLESSFETLRDLRENCKNDLELTDNSHINNR